MITIATIQARVASHFGCSVSQLRGHRRHRSLARARAIAMYLARELTRSSFPEIGQRFGGKDHTTIMYACRRVAADAEMLAEAQALAVELNPGTPAPVSA